MKHGSLFSGIGGFDLAAEWMGWENKFHCEWNEFGQKVLKYYWPEAESFSDITKTDFTKYNGTIDIISGGFPCQPYSSAGKRKGKEDERHLWPEMLRTVREVQPCWIVGENVRGLTNWNGGMVFDEVQSDLETEGYEVLPFLLPACAKDAPHRRDRIWFIAYSDGARKRRIQASKQRQYTQEVRIQDTNRPKDFVSERHVANTNGDKRSEGWLYQAKQQEAERHFSAFDAFSNAGSAWNNFPTQSPIRSGNDGVPSDMDTSTFSKSKWNEESLKAAGNAIVPQVAFEIFKAIQEYNNFSNLP